MLDAFMAGASWRYPSTRCQHSYYSLCLGKLCARAASLTTFRQNPNRRKKEKHYRTTQKKHPRRSSEQADDIQTSLLVKSPDCITMTLNEDKSTSPVMSSSPVQSSGGKGKARIIGSAVAGFTELALFHPVDTVAKRLMST